MHLILIIIIFILLRGVNGYIINSEYVSKLYYNPGTCTMNDCYSMIFTLFLMYKKFDEYRKINKLTDRIAEKFKIVKIQKPNIIHKEMAPNQMPLVQKSFALDGFLVEHNRPLKLHTCFNCEAEAVYRQVQSKVDYDDAELLKFKEFIQPKIKQLIDDSDVKMPSINEYLSKLGIKRNEFAQGLEELIQDYKLNLTYKMHVKVDEKIYINYSKYKMKARNISAQNRRVKLIMGLVCETLMKILHNQPWSGPGTNNAQKCKIFSSWVEEIGPKTGIICADGSAFDSTQHSAIQEIVDNYAFKCILDKMPEIDEIVDRNILKRVLFQQFFKIYSKYFAYYCKGTQMTGRMNTCLGNTLRSWAYVEYIKHNMKLKYNININLIKEMVNGDDQIIFMPIYYFEIYEKVAYENVYYKEDVSIKHGLGQIAKIFDKYPKMTGAEFLSMILLYDPITNTFIMVRKLERFMQMTPYTYNNKFLNIFKFRLLNAELMIADALNIIQSNTLDIFHDYARKMLEIGIMEKDYVLKHYIISDKLKYKIAKKLENYRFIASFKDRMNAEYDRTVFNDIFNKYLYENFNINEADINEYYNVLNNINIDNYMEHYQLNIIDKLNKVKSYKTYQTTMREINKTSIDVNIQLKDNKSMNITQITNFI